MWKYELKPGDPIPEDVSTVFLGAKDETPETTRPEDTWSPDEHSLQDGLHIYETFEYGYTGAYSKFGRKMVAMGVIDTHLVRPIVTRRFVEETNARAVASGGQPLIISQAELDESLARIREKRKNTPKPTLLSKALGFLGVSRSSGFEI
jgi:hypothetical protein